MTRFNCCIDVFGKGFMPAANLGKLGLGLTAQNILAEEKGKLLEPITRELYLLFNEGGWQKQLERERERLQQKFVNKEMEGQA